MGMGRSMQEIAARFASPGVCLVAEKQGRMVGYLWLLRGQYREPDDGCIFILNSAQIAWDLDIFVDPAFRLSPVFARLWEAANAWLRDNGVTWTLSRISCHNQRSLQSHARLGFIRVGRMMLVKLGPLQFTLATIVPYLHIKLCRENGPTFLLHAPTRDVERLTRYPLRE
jgi:GNAT superfamily N-acetyltransferase